MAAPVYVNAGTFVVDTAGAWTYTCQAAAAAGNIFIVQVVQDGTTTGQVTITGGTNITNLAGTANAWTVLAVDQPIGTTVAARHHLFIGRSTGTAAPTISGNNAAGEDLFYKSAQFSGVNAGPTLADVIENGTAGAIANGAGFSAAFQAVDDTAVVTLGSDRLALNYVGLNDDDRPTSFPGATGGTWALAFNYAGIESTGTDAAIMLLTASMPSAGTINGGGGTGLSVTNISWGVIGFALKPVAAAGPATLERSAVLTLVGLIASIGRELLPRSAALSATGLVASNAVFWTTFERQVAANATGLIASSGVRAAAPITRQAALNATGLIATVGRELLPRTAALTATGLVATAGQVIHVRSRQAALTATGLIASVGRELLPRTAALNATGLVSASGVKVGGAATVERSASLTATGLIATAARELLARSASLTATGLIASSGRELLPRLSRVDATGLISAVGQRRLHRQTVLGATATIAANGLIEGGAATVERSAALTATGSIATVRLRVHVRQAALAGTGTVAVAYQRRHHRAALVTATGTVTVGFSRSWSSAATVSATPSVSARPQRLLLRAGTLNATGDIELIAGGNTAQFSFEAIATITVVVPWYAGAISTPTTGFIYGAYLGAIQGGSSGRIATGTDGQLAKTGG